MCFEEESKNVMETKQVTAHKQLLKKVLKKRFILDTLCNIKMENLEDQLELKRALQYAQVAEYLHFGGQTKGNVCLLNLQDCQNFKLSYSERKLLHMQLTKDLMKRMQPTNKYSTELVKENENLLQEITTIKSQQRENYATMASLQIKSINLLIKAIELQLGDGALKDLEILQKQAALLKSKAELLRSFIIQGFVTSTEHTVKAIKIIEANIDEILANAEKDKAKENK